MVINKTKVGFPVFLLSALMLFYCGTSTGQTLEAKHLAKFKNNCATCHVENPAAKPVGQDKCIACHGDLKKVGSKPIPKGEVNAHINHVDEMYCNDCHNIHKPSKNYCEQCHDDGWGLKVP